MPLRVVSQLAVNLKIEEVIKRDFEILSSYVGAKGLHQVASACVNSGLKIEGV